MKTAAAVIAAWVERRLTSTSSLVVLATSRGEGRVHSRVYSLHMRLQMRHDMTI